MRGILAVAIVCISLAPLTALSVTIDTVLVGNRGNANDPSDGDENTGGIQHFGSVAYSYRIGTYEVTNAQYAEFLNAKAASDPLRLYNPNMNDFASGGITRSGASGNFTYSLKANMANKPVNFVSWYDAIRFANWLHNGEGIGDTENGAYALGQLSASGEPLDIADITRNLEAKWFLPSENEWYKAAYYQPNGQGGDVDDYWLYATRSNDFPNIATAINAIGPTRGDIANPGVNVVNHFRGADWNFQDGNVTTVGSAGPLSQSFYGTSDQNGNVLEWSETLIGNSFPVTRGGRFNSFSTGLASSSRGLHGPFEEYAELGFRVATIATVPEPSTLALAALGVLGLLIAARRRR